MLMEEILQELNDSSYHTHETIKNIQEIFDRYKELIKNIELIDDIINISNESTEILILKKILERIKKYEK